MKMTAVDIRAHPKFHRYVKNEVPKLVHVPAIVNAIKKFSGTTPKATIKRGLTWGQGPTIRIVPGLMCGAVRAFGCYPWGGATVQIDKALVQAYEAGRDRRATRRGKFVNVAGVTLLHELTHWADAQDGTDNPVPGDPTNEEGNAFEREVYGKIVVL